MPDRFLRRQVITAALTANALRPFPGYWAGIPTMAAGWLTTELAPHLAAVTAADTLTELTLRRRDGHARKQAVGLAVASIAGLAYLMRESQGAKDDVEGALIEALGEKYREELTKVYTDIDMATPWQQLAMPFRIQHPEVDVVKNITYAGRGSRRGLLDIYRPAGGPVEGAPVLLQVHGGGWTIGTKDQQGIPLMLHMAARGWVCVAINYRLSPKHPFPTHLVDVKRSIAWIRENIEQYGGDPSYVAITGGSAGGHLTALAALTPNDPEYQPGFEGADTTVQAAVPHYGVYDFAGVGGDRRTVKMRDAFLGPHVLKKDPALDLADFERASPLLRVSPDAPPFFVLHGAHDSLVPVAQAREFVRRLREVSKNPVAYAELPGTQHAFDVFPSIRSAHVVRGVDRFLRWNYGRWKDSPQRSSA
ncbi:MAG TPA: alpha/beta hydrolase [Nocardioidaceae bacterium]|nr:alpha/beta hydrolase [Nocardioidaceae bacterium]